MSEYDKGYIDALKEIEQLTDDLKDNAQKNLDYYGGLFNAYNEIGDQTRKRLLLMEGKDAN